MSGIIKADSIGRLAAAIYDGKNRETLFGNHTISARELSLTKGILAENSS